MVKVRQDAWSHEDDLLLAETVLRHIREGSTQLNAFEEVGDELNRTSAACGFRWNAEVRNKYISAIELAKRQRKELKRSETKQQKQMQLSNLIDTETTELIVEENSNQEMNLDNVLTFLTNLKKNYDASNQSKLTVEQLKHENAQLNEEIVQLEKRLKDTEKELETITGDYQAFIQIMERARKMTVLKEEKPLSSPAFRMDKNGNLQQIANQSN